VWRPIARLVVVAAIGAAPAAAQEQPSSPQPGASQAWSFRTSVKSSLLVSRAPDAPQLFPERDSAVSYWRARFEPTVHVGTGLTFGAAYEQRLRVFNQAPGLGGVGIVPVEAPASYRIAQLDWAITEHAGLSWHHEIDRAYVGWRLPSANITIGRQAIGWGRGVMFGAIDFLSPFSPLEADREWRRGVDAVRAEVSLADRVSIDGFGVFGERIDDSAFAGRLRAYAGETDLEVVGGRRGRDLFGGATTSAAIRNAEVHGEVVVFRATDIVQGLETKRTVAKATLGGSYQFGIGPGLLTFVEYHYSGFGVTRPENILPALADPAFIERLLRGDMQILGRHAVAVTASSELSPTLVLGGQWLHSPTDGSGVVTPTTTLTFNDQVSLGVSLYVSYGRAPEGMTLRSEYGARGVSGFVQLRLYL
jgi:hypothetical protein